MAQLPGATWAQAAQPGLQCPQHTAPELCPGKHHCSFRSPESSSCLKQRSCFSALPLTAHGFCHFGERRHLRHTKKCHMAVWEGTAISTQSKPRCCSKALALTILNQHYTIATWGIEKCINSFGIPHASSQSAAPAGLPARSKFCAAAVLPGAGRRHCLQSLELGVECPSPYALSSRWDTRNAVLEQLRERTRHLLHCLQPLIHRGQVIPAEDGKGSWLLLGSSYDT